MKTRLVKLFTLSICAMAITWTVACAPKDQKIVKAPRDGQVTTTGAADGKADNYKHLALLVDRQVEAIQLYKALTNAEFAQSKAYKIEGQQLKLITQELVRVEAGEFTLTTQNYLQAVVENDEQGTFKKAVITDVAAKLSTESITKKANKSNIVVKNNHKNIIFEKAEDNSVNVSFESSDEINAQIGKMFATNKMNFNFTQIDANNFKINSITMDHKRYGQNQTSDFSMLDAKDSDGKTLSDVTITFNEKCASINGKILLNSTEVKPGGKTPTEPLYTRNFGITDSTYEIIAGKDTFTMKAAACEHRAASDLSKLF